MNKLSLHHKELKTKNKPNPKLLEEKINIRVEINQMRTKYKNPMKQRIDSFKKKKQGRKKGKQKKEGRHKPIARSSRKGRRLKHVKVRYENADTAASTTDIQMITRLL